MRSKNFEWFLGIVFVLLVIVLLYYVAVPWFKSNPSSSDLNSSADITSTINPDGTMGPATWQGNYSNTLSDSMVGSLSFGITDPPPPGRGAPSFVPARPSTAGGGPQTVTSLMLTVNKVEVHLAMLTAGPTGTAPGVDKWETLNIGGTKTVDLVSLAKTGNVSLLGITKLAGGRYTEIRLYVSSATATLPDGTVVSLKVLGTDKIVKVVRSWVVIAGQTLKLVMDFDAQHAVIKAGDNYILRPVVARVDVQ